MKVSALHQAVAVAVAASIQQLSCQTVNPGFRVIITSKALNYGKQLLNRLSILSIAILGREIKVFEAVNLMLVFE